MYFKKIVSAFESAGYEVRSYSGRGMYGKECLAVTSEASGNVIINVVLQIMDAINGPSSDAYYESVEAAKNLIQSLQNHREDSIGRSSIIYWPNIAWEDDQDENSDDEDEE